MPAPLAALTLTDHVTPTVLLALTFALGVGGALMGPAWQAIQPDLVPAREFGQAVALSSLTFNTGRAIGPALAGALVASAGAEWAFVVNAASFLGVVAVLLRWRPQRSSVRLSTESLPGAVRAGLRYGVHAPALLGILVRTLAFAAPAAAIHALLPIVVRDQLDIGSGGYGILLGCFGFGAAASALLRPRIDALLTSDQCVTAASLVLGVVLVLVGTIASPWVVGAALLAGGGGLDDGHGDTQRVDAGGAAVVGPGPWPRAVPRRARRWHRRRQRAVGDDRRVEHPGRPRVAATVLLAGIVTSRRWRLAVVRDLDLRPATTRAPIVNLEPAPTPGRCW